MDCPRGHRRRRADGLDGLSQLAHDLQDAQVSQLLGMISAGRVAIGNVHGSHHVGRVLHARQRTVGQFRHPSRFVHSTRTRTV